MSMQIKLARASTQGSGRVMPGIGDPGLFGFLGSVAKKAAGFLPGPIGGIVTGILGGAAAGGLSRNGQIVSKFQEIQQLPGPPKPGPIEAIRRAIPGGQTGRFEQVACATGFHPNKADYFLKDGTFVPEGTKCVKNRRRNPLNPKALDRAMGRITSAKKKEENLKRITIRKKVCK
jgi:hypothetical protein